MRGHGARWVIALGVLALTIAAVGAGTLADFSSAWLIGLGAVLAGLGSLLSGMAALLLAQKRGRESVEADVTGPEFTSAEAQASSRMAAKDAARDVPDEFVIDNPEGDQ